MTARKIGWFTGKSYNNWFPAIKTYLKTPQPFQVALLAWYQKNKRDLPWRATRDPYAIWVSEVMLQQTQVKTVIPYYYRWMEAFPNINTFASAPQDRVLKLWEGLGYYARARNFQRAALQIATDFDGEIPREFDQFIQLSGVGDYTAAAVMSIAFNQPFAVVDGNVKRVLSRLFCLSEPVNDGKHKPLFQQIADQLLAVEDAGNYNQALMELGATICKPQSPNCSSCPVHSHCCSFKEGRQGAFPVKLKRKAIPLRFQVAAVIHDGESVLVRQRPQAGLLGGLWEFPVVESSQDDRDPAVARKILADEIGVSPGPLYFLKTVTHAYTHFRISVNVFVSENTFPKENWSLPDSYRWVALQDLSQFAFSKYNLLIIKSLDTLK